MIPPEKVKCVINLKLSLYVSRWQLCAHFFLCLLSRLNSYSQMFSSRQAEKWLLSRSSRCFCTCNQQTRSPSNICLITLFVLTLGVTPIWSNESPLRNITSRSICYDTKKCVFSTKNIFTTFKFYMFYMCLVLHSCIFNCCKYADCTLFTCVFLWFAFMVHCYP